MAEALPAILAFPAAGAIEMCRRLERRFRCVGIQQIALNNKQAAALALRPGQRVTVTAWAMALPRAAEAFHLFVGDANGENCAPASLRGAFGPTAVIGPLFDAVHVSMFFSPEALFSVAPVTSMEAAALAQVSRAPSNAAQWEEAAPAKAVPAKAAPPKAAQTKTTSSNAAQSKANNLFHDVVSPRAGSAKPSQKVEKTKTAPAPASPTPQIQALPLSASPFMASNLARPPPRPRLSPLVSLEIERAQATSGPLVELSIDAIRSAVVVSVRDGGLQITPAADPTVKTSKATRSEAASEMRQRAQASQLSEVGGARHSVRGPQAVPLTGGHFRSAKESAAAAHYLWRTDRASQYAFHSGRLPWQASST